MHDNFLSIKYLVLSFFTTRNIYFLCMIFLIFCLLVCFTSFLCMTTFSPSNILYYLPIWPEISILCTWYFLYFPFLIVYVLFNSCAWHLSYYQKYLFSVHDMCHISPNCLCFISFLCMTNFSPSNTSYCLILLPETSIICAWSFLQMSYFFFLIVYLFHFTSVQENFHSIKLL
jgi:hypothetical protein